MLRDGSPAGADAVESLAEYLAIGQQVADVVEQSLAACDLPLERVGSLLDCGCGHGRGTRFLLGRLPAARLAVVDRSASAVEYHRECFGVRGATSLAALGEPPFDAVASIALFS